MTVVTIVTLGRGSEEIVGNSKYMRTCPGLKRQNSRTDSGRGSQTASSQTSRFGSGCDLDSAVLVVNMFERYRNSEEEIGEESTRTRRAEGVEGAVLIDASNIR
jgi:hypothetical protein